MSTRAERKARRNAMRCRGCGEWGAHYVGASFGDPGFYICVPGDLAAARAERDALERLDRP